MNRKSGAIIGLIAAGVVLAIASPNRLLADPQPQAGSTAQPPGHQQPPTPGQPAHQHPPTPGQPGQPQQPHVGQPLQPPPPPGQALAIGQEHPKITGPGIALDTPAYEFGRMMGGADIRHDYWFTNIGTENLEITSVRPSCGCTTMGDWDRVVPPGRTGRIPIKIATGKMTGRISKMITVTTNAKDQPNLLLRVEGDLWQPVQVEPQYIAMGRLQGDTLTKPSTKEAIITNNMKEPMEIKSVDAQSTMFKAEVTPIEAGKKYKLVVTSIPPFPVGSVVANVKITTNIAGASEVIVPASAYVPPPLQVIPPQLHLPPQTADGYDRKIYIQNNAGGPFKVSNVKCADPKLGLSITPQAGPMGYELTIKVPANYQAPGTGVLITMDTDVANAKSTTIPVTQGAMNPVMPRFQPTVTTAPPKPAGAGAAIQPGGTNPGPAVKPAEPKPAGGAGH